MNHLKETSIDEPAVGLEKEAPAANREIAFLIEQLTDAYEGEPWFGKCAVKLIEETGEQKAFEKIRGQHSILELVWHMGTWREFALSRLQKDVSKDLHFFEQNDWRELDHSDRSLWRKGVENLRKTQAEIISELQKKNDKIFEEKVWERTYNYRKLLYGIVQHDSYHLGQIAYILKLLNQ